MRFGRTTCLAGVLASVAVVGAACTRTPPEEATTTTAEPTATDARSDAGITTSVQAKFYADDAVRARPIDVDTENGVVTLRGNVENNTVKERAVTLARSVEGVTRVEDQLQVSTQTAAAEPPPAAPQEAPAQQPAATTGRESEISVQPAWITTKIQAQYFASPEIKPWNIDVTTSSAGVVTLEGEVDTAEDKAEAVRIARATDGVSSVVDRLRTKGEAAAPSAEAAREGTGAGSVAPDAWLTAKIQAKYFVDDEVKARDIDVTTQNGVVTLSGVVEDEAERRQAVALARSTDGVRDVTDQLRVDPEAAKSAARPLPLPNIRPIGPIDADPWITTKVQAKYFLDPAIKGLSINVNTDKGVVTLKGTVPDEQAKQEAERIARETDGVSKVVNELLVGQR